MANTGLEDVMKAAFCGIGKMVSGKNFAQNLGALRMVTEEVLSNIIESGSGDLMETLEDKAGQNKTAKVWFLYELNEKLIGLCILWQLRTCCHIFMRQAMLIMQDMVYTT